MTLNDPMVAVGDGVVPEISYEAQRYPARPTKQRPRAKRRALEQVVPPPPFAADARSPAYVTWLLEQSMLIDPTPSKVIYHKEGASHQPTDHHLHSRKRSRRCRRRLRCRRAAAVRCRRWTGTDRTRPVVATPACWSKSRCSVMASAGVFQPSVLRGRLLSARAAAWRSSAVQRDRSVPLGASVVCQAGCE